MEESPASVRPNRVPTLFIKMELYIAISKLCKENRKEWSLFGKTEKLVDGDYRLIDVKIPKQKNSGGSTEMTEEGLEEIFDEIAEDCFNTDPNAPRWNVWIHSHNVMGCFWSGTDHNQMDEFSKLGAPMMMSVVVSMKDSVNGDWCKMLGSFSVYTPFRGDFEMTVKPSFNQDEYTELYTPAWKAAVNEGQTDSGLKTFIYDKLNGDTLLYESLQEDLTEKEVPFSPYQSTWDWDKGPKKGFHGHYDDDEDTISESEVKALLVKAAFTDEKKNQEVIDRLVMYQWGFSHFLNMSRWAITPICEIYKLKEKQVRKRLVAALPDNHK